jgi:hypothetical protein
VLTEVLILLLVVGLLETSGRFRALRRSLDEHALLSLKRVIRVAEDHGYPPELIPMLMLLILLSWMAMSSLTRAFAR